MMQYRPEPIQTDHVKLAPQIEELMELLARNTHDVWAVRKIREGWTYGEALCKKSMTHPDLIHYEELSESQKDYDRSTARETLGAIQLLGYDIVPRRD